MTNIINPLKQRLLVGLAYLANNDGIGDYNSLFRLHKFTKIPLSKIKPLLNELNEEGVINLHPNNLNLEEAA